ncbi:MAG: RNA 2',3'-cyclic phosphodiesterase [Proteobacteria bacterium]|nr:RNA 2',3'-cyclic phosphodiesterase [Pseudomonadota bacterium]
MNSNRGKIRLFFGVKVAMATVESLARVAESLRRSAYDAGYQIRWVTPATYHVTLKFLGWSQPEIVTALCDDLAPLLAEKPCFDFTTEGVGAFPSDRNARVIWAGVDDPAGHLEALASVIEDKVTNLGFQKERRPFHPHVTLGRVKRTDDVSSLLSQASERKFSTTRVDRVILFESVIKSIGSEYMIQAELPLLRGPDESQRQTEPLKVSSAQHASSVDGEVASLGAEAKPAAVGRTPRQAMQGEVHAERSGRAAEDSRGAEPGRVEPDEEPTRADSDGPAERPDIRSEPAAEMQSPNDHAVPVSDDEG